MSTKGKTSKKNDLALVAISSVTLTDKQRIAKLQNVISEQIALVGRVEHENIVRRLFVGLGLIVIKASLKHGQWLPWFKKHAPGASYRQCAYMMSAARDWIKSQELGGKDLAVLPAGEWSLDLKDDAFSKLSKSAEKFIGGMTWGELLDANNIKDAGKIGGARTKGKPGAPATPDEETLYFAARDEIGGFLNRGEEMLVKENRLQFLAKHPEEVRGVVEGLRTLADRVEKAAKPILEK